MRELHNRDPKLASRTLRVVLVIALAALASTGRATDPFEEVFPVAAMEDPTTLRLERTGERFVDSEVVPGARLRVIQLEFTSFTWADEEWRHQAALVLPADGVPERAQGTGVVAAGMKTYADAAAAVLGVPALLITSGNPGPRYGEPNEGELMGWSLERQAISGDPRWNGYAWLGKVVVRGVTVLASLPETRTERAVVTGCSKRGMAAWIAAAADRRVVGAFPTCWNTGDYQETAKLMLDRLGGDYQRGRTDTKAPAFVAVREQYERTLTPQFSTLAALTDPVLFRDRIADKKILYAFGTNDPLYHVLSCNLLLSRLGENISALAVPNTVHTPDTPQHLTAWTMWVAHSLLGRAVPGIVIETEGTRDQLTVRARVTSGSEIERVELWWATDQLGRYNDSTWGSAPMSPEAGTFRATIPRDAGRYLALFVAVYDRDRNTCAGYTTSQPFEVRPDSSG